MQQRQPMRTPWWIFCEKPSWWPPCFSQKLNRGSGVKDWLIPSKTFKLSYGASPLMMRNISCTQMEQFRLIWVLELGSCHRAFYLVNVVPRGSLTESLLDKRCDLEPRVGLFDNSLFRRKRKRGKKKGIFFFFWGGRGDKQHLNFVYPLHMILTM